MAEDGIEGPQDSLKSRETGVNENMLDRSITRSQSVFKLLVQNLNALNSQQYARGTKLDHYVVLICKRK